MKKINIIKFIIFLSIFSAVTSQQTFCQAAESTADVAVDYALKEKLRQEITGTENFHEVDKEYSIGYHDILLISIYGEGYMAAGTDSAGQASGNKDNGFIRGRGKGIEVRGDGRISLRHIGDVYVKDLTLTQLANYLKKLYNTIYENPAVTVTLAQSNSRNYTVMGQVKAPGLYHIDFPITIVKAIAKAGGFSEWANSKVTVIRQEIPQKNKTESEQEKTDQQMKSDKSSDKHQFEFNLGNFLKKENKHLFEFNFNDFLDGDDIDKNIIIKNNDVIVVH